MKLLVASAAVVFALAILAGWAALAPGPKFTNFVWYITVATLVVSVIGAFHATGEVQEFLRGFAVFGVAYFLMSTLFGNFKAADEQVHKASHSLPRPVLMTTWVLAWSYDALSMPEMWTSGGTKATALNLLSVRSNSIPDGLIVPEFTDFMNTGHCLLSVALGLVGGWMGRWLHGHESLEESAAA